MVQLQLYAALVVNVVKIRCLIKLNCVCCICMMEMVWQRASWVKVQHFIMCTFKSHKAASLS